MRTEKFHAVAAVVLAGILVVTAATPSFARNGRWAAAGVGFAAGVSGGALLADRAYGYGYYGGYGYAPYYGGYYAPSYYARPPAYRYGYAPYYGYAENYYYPRRVYAYSAYRPYLAYYRGNYYGPRYGYYRWRW